MRGMGGGSAVTLGSPSVRARGAVGVAPGSHIVDVHWMYSNSDPLKALTARTLSPFSR